MYTVAFNQDNTLSTLFEWILHDRSHVHHRLSLSLSCCGLGEKSVVLLCS